MMSGLHSVYKPAALIKTTTVFSTVNYYETSTNDMVFALLGSVGTRVKISENFSLSLSSSYLGSTFDFVFYRNNKEVQQETHIGVLSFQGGVYFIF